MFSDKTMNKLEAIGIKAKIEELLNNEEYFGPTVESMFKQYDKDNSGFIDIDEFYTCLTQLNDNSIHLPGFSKEKAKDHLKQLDTNNDGKLNKEECRPFMKQFLKDIIQNLQKIIDTQ